MSDSPADQISIHVPRMYRVAYRLLADSDRAHDVVQEACLKALANLDGFDGRATMTTWLHRITVNCAKDAMRRDGRKEHARQGLQAQTVNRASPPPPSEAAETRELTDLAWMLLEELPEDCRSAFILTQIDGYPYDEAAEIEGRPRGTIASRVYRAKRILLEQMNARTDGRAPS